MLLVGQCTPDKTVTYVSDIMPSGLCVCVFLCVLGDVIHGYMEGKLGGGVGDDHLGHLEYCMRSEACHL